MTENLDRYKDDYIREAGEHIDLINQYLLKLEKEPNKLALFGEILHHVHTLKSMAATMNYNKTTKICHAIENVLLALKNNKLKLSDCIGVLFKDTNLLANLLKSVQSNKKKPEIVSIIPARFVPIGFVFDRFKRMIRDLAKNQNKKINLLIEGADIELDRTIIDEIGESLMHLLRNAVDHGIESPVERLKIGKLQQATIKMIATRNGNNVVIKISDDGRGLALEKIKEKAMELGVIDKSATPAEIKNSIFFGVSTTKQATVISGRGLGLSIVKNKIESLDGTVKVVTEAQKGTTFILEVPLVMRIS